MTSNLLRVARSRRAGGEGAKGAPPRYMFDGGPSYRTKPVVGVGRSPRARSAANLDVTDAQREVLDLLPPPGTAPERASAIAQNLNRSAAGVTASLYALADRGLVERVPFNGWRRK